MRGVIWQFTKLAPRWNELYSKRGLYTKKYFQRRKRGSKKWLFHAALLIRVTRQLLARGEPDTGPGLHVGDQVIQVLHWRAMAAQVRMEGEDEDGTFLVGA